MPYYERKEMSNDHQIIVLLYQARRFCFLIAITSRFTTWYYMSGVGVKLPQASFLALVSIFTTFTFTLHFSTNTLNWRLLFVSSRMDDWFYYDELHHINLRGVGLGSWDGPPCLQMDYAQFAYVHTYITYITFIMLCRHHRLIWSQKIDNNSDMSCCLMLN